MLCWSAPLTVRTTSSIDYIDQPQWDALSGHHVVTTHAWLTIAERTARLPQRYIYFLAEDAHGLAGGLYAQLHESSGWLSLDDLLLGPYLPLTRFPGVSLLPALVCGSEFAAGEAILLRPGSGAAEALLAAAERHATQNGWSVCFRNIPAHSPVADLLRSRQYLRSIEWPTTILDLPGPTFLDYRHELRKTHPSTERNLPRERNKAKRQNLQISTSPHPGLHSLYEAHYQRLNAQPFPYQPDFFTELTSRLHQTAEIYTAILDDQLLGATLLLKYGDSVHLPLIAFDPVRGHDAAVYFNLAYNEPIDRCAAAGFRRLLLGRTQYAVKLQRGGRLVELELYLRPHSWLQSQEWPLLLAARNVLMRRRLAAIANTPTRATPQ